MHGRPDESNQSETPDAAIRRVVVQRVGGDGPDEADDVLAVEEALEIRIGFRHPNGKDAVSRASVTMRTPGHDEELALGFLYAEGIIRAPGDVTLVTPCADQSAGAIRIELAKSVEVDWSRLQRFVTIASSCGACGKTSVQALETANAPQVPRDAGTTTADVIHGLPAKLREAQAGFHVTGGLHAAAMFTPAGDLVAVREDVGRHNAVDKLVGYALRQRILPWHDGLLMLSGRASFELVQKAAMAGIPLIAAVGAPSSLAVELAAEHGITLCGFVRDDRFNIYTADWRVQR